MSNKTPTPGPWRYDYAPGYCGEIIAANGELLATFNDEPSAENAKLLTAAPELLAELKNIANAKRFSTEHFPDGDESFAAWAQSRARHAIEKLEGPSDVC